MTITKDVSAKFAVAIVAVSMVFSAFATSAKAQTTEDLQKMINDLLAQVAALQSQAGQGASAAAGVCPYTWTRDLNTGATGADVKMLQQFLNADADTRVAASGVGSAGMETETYGPMTAAAVSKLQVKYRADILSPANLVNPTGYFGPSTRAKANALCVAPAEGEEEEEGEEGEEEEEESGELGGEASLKTFETDSASDDTIEEGAEDAEIAEVTVEFEDGDAEISRIDLALESTDTTESDPWDTFETISLWVDGDKVAEMNVDSEDDYLDEDLGELRFSGLDLVAMEDEEVEIVVAATVQGSVDGTDNGNAWTVEFDAIRFFDADGVATTENGIGDLGNATGESFTVEEAGADDEVTVKASTNDPDATTLQVEDDEKSDWYTVFVFDLDTDDSINDIELNTIKVNASTTKAAYNTLVDDAELVIDGVTIDDVTVAYGNSATTSAILTFDVDGDVVIEAGERVAAELKLRFKSLAPANEGATVKGSIQTVAGTPDVIDAEGADDIATGDITGAATGEVHTLRTTGVITEATDDSAVVTTGDGAGDDYATFEIDVEVTAFEQDVYIPTDASTVDVDILSSTSSVLAAAPTVVLTSSGQTVTGRYEITEGETETITVKVTYDPATTNVSAKMLLKSIGFYEAASGGTLQTQTTLPAEDYDTDTVTMVN